MLAKLEKLGDHLLSMVVPRAQASANPFCFCTYDGDCDVSRIRYKCCYSMSPTQCWHECNYKSPCS